MPRNTSVSLGDHFVGFINERVELEDHEPKVEALREALIEGEQSGPATPFDFDAFVTRKKST